MNYKERILSHPLFPKHPYVMVNGETLDLKKQVEAGGYETTGKQPWQKQEGPEVRLDFTREDGVKGYMYFYFDKDRNPEQTSSANLIFGSKWL